MTSAVPCQIETGGRSRLLERIAGALAPLGRRRVLRGEVAGVAEVDAARKDRLGPPCGALVQDAGDDRATGKQVGVRHQA